MFFFSTLKGIGRRVIRYAHVMESSRGSDGRRSAYVRNPTAPKLGKVLTPAAMPDDDFGDEKTLKGREYRGTDLAGRIASGFDIEQCRFDGARLADCTLTQVIVSDSVIERCDLANLRGSNISLIQASVVASRLTGSSWANGLFRDVMFSECRADLAHFRYAKLKTVAFENCNLRQADFQWAEFRGVRFVSCDLSGAQFANAAMQNVSFADCDLSDVGGVTSFKGATVRGGDLLSLASSLAREIGIRVEP